jgi:DNA repair exonuclease SbcCD nuclease subunit
MQVVSDTSLIQSGVDNTQDPCLNVGLPVFTIHGNHDDPSGPEHFSAVDVLSSIHYVNYFGKQKFYRDEENDIGKIKLSPLLLVKVCCLRTRLSFILLTGYSTLHEHHSYLVGGFNGLWRLYEGKVAWSGAWAACRDRHRTS